MTTNAITLPKSLLKNRILMISAFALLTGLTAWIKIPLGFTPVPLTLQTAVVLLSGVVLGKDGVHSQLLYLLLGGIGLPFFASDLPGVQALFGATGGYLIGFVFASAFVGYVVQPHWHQLSYVTKVAYLSIASLLVFIPGTFQLWMMTDFSLTKVLALGFYPFILGDLLKVALVSLTPNKALIR
jgi:biotin transport system substrate-specific component